MGHYRLAEGKPRGATHLGDSGEAVVGHAEQDEARQPSDPGQGSAGRWSHSAGMRQGPWVE